MDINKILTDLKTATNEEIATLWALLKEKGNSLVDIVKHDLLGEEIQANSSEPNPPPGSTTPPAP